MSRPFAPALLALLVACGGSGQSPDASFDAGDVPFDTARDPGLDGSDDVPQDVGPDAVDPGADVDPADPGPFAWPLPTGDVPVTPSDDWRNRVAFPEDPFLVRDYDGNYRPLPGFIKFAVLVRDPSKVYFQDGQDFKFHYDFATQRLDPFLGMDRAAFDAVSLRQSGQEVILGALVYPPDAGIREAGIQLVRQDAYHPEMVRVVFDLVRNAIDADGPLSVFYFPTYEQQDSARHWSGWLRDRGVEVSSVERWADASHCYVTGWALGRLVEVPGGEIRQAYSDGRLLPTDVLLTDGVPAEVPYVAGILAEAPSTPNSHVAILADAFRIPFASLALPADRAAAKALVGRTVALRVGSGWGTCDVRLADATGLSQPLQDEVLALKTVPAADVPARVSPGRLWRDVDELGHADVKSYGGKASHYGILRRAIPDNTDPGLALSFDLFDAVMAQPAATGKTLRQAVAERLSGHAWPPDMAKVATDLAWVRSTVAAVGLPDDLKPALWSALQDFPAFQSNRRLRFRSSTNVEDVETFVGAGLYESASGCLMDDVDSDASGPSACAPYAANEKTVASALGTVLASFWNDNAYLERLRRGVDESTVGMAVLVHHSFPDADELANGVAVVTVDAGQASDVRLVTQAGAVSVTNPDGGSQPEVVGVYIGFGQVYLTLLSRSSLVPLGGTVMAWEDDYKALVALLQQVAARFATETSQSAFVLDLEYKKMAPGRLVVKQVRQLPRPASTTLARQLLLPGTHRACVFQGEYGDVLANHRLKSRWTITTRAAWTDALASSSFLQDVAFEGREGDGVATFQGDPTTFPGFAHAQDSEAVRDSFRRGEGAAARTLTLSSQLPQQVSSLAGPFLWWDEAYTYLQADYDTPRPAWNAWDGATTLVTESVRLAACTGPDDVTATFPRQQHAWDIGDGVTIDASWWWPPPPKGATAGYTASLVAWDAVAIAGLTDTPLVLSSDWARTYRPGHHNFSEDFLFEPGLDPSVTEAQRAQLLAKGIRALLVTATPWDGPTAVSVMKPDGTFEAWTHLPAP